MKTDSNLTKTQFDDLLIWLDPDPNRAADKYEIIRRRLIWFYLNRQCSMAEDLTDETINRVAKKPKEWKEQYEGDPVLYFYAVARNVFREYCREIKRKIDPPPDPSRPELEPYLDCLKRCLEKLTSESRNLILPYYQERKRAKIDCRKEMKNKIGLSPGALRARIHRIRTKLRNCVEECLGKISQSNDMKSEDI
jgi:RNA polymerase sigma factor (sigma-70 family)